MARVGERRVTLYDCLGVRMGRRHEVRVGHEVDEAKRHAAALTVSQDLALVAQAQVRLSKLEAVARALA